MAADTVVTSPAEIAAALDAVGWFLEDVSRLPWLEHKHEEISELRARVAAGRDNYKERFKLDSNTVELDGEELLKRLGLDWPPNYVRYGAEFACLETKLTKLAERVIGVEWNEASQEWDL